VLKSSGRKNQKHKDSEQQQMNATLQNVRPAAGEGNHAHG